MRYFQEERKKITNLIDRLIDARFRKSQPNAADWKQVQASRVKEGWYKFSWMEIPRWNDNKNETFSGNEWFRVFLISFEFFFAERNQRTFLFILSSPWLHFTDSGEDLELANISSAHSPSSPRAGPFVCHWRSIFAILIDAILNQNFSILSHSANANGKNLQPLAGNFGPFVSND